MAGQPLPPAATPPLLRVEELFSNPAAVDAVVSPDGQWIASLRPRQGRLDIYLSPAASGPGRWATRATSHPIENVRWSVDGRRILYRQDQGGDEGYHLFAADLGTAGPSSPRDLTPFPGTETELIAAPVATPNTVLITLNRRNPALADAVRLHLDTGVLEVAAENPGTFLGYLADGRNQVRVAYSLDSAGRYSLHARSSDREPWHVVRTFPVEDKITPLRLHPDGLRIYALSNADVDLTQLVLIDLTTGAETVVDSDPERQVDLETVLFDEESGEVIASRYAADTIRWYARSPVVTRLLHRMAAAGLTPSEIGPSDRAGTKWVVHVESPTDPGAGYLYDDARGTLRRLYRSRRGLDPAHLAPTRPIRFSARDGLQLAGYLTLPRGRAPRGLPLVLAVHGGPWSRDQWQFEPQTQFFANRGYAVLQVNFRGSSGYGKKFARAARKEFARAMHQDLLDAVRWAVDTGLVDSTRVAILGGSYGGYAALVGLTFTPGVFRCAVDFAGPSDLITLIEAFPPSWQPFLPRNWFPFVGNPALAEDRVDLASRSPIHRADSARAPLLIFQGANDPRVTQAQSDRIARVLHRRGIPVTYLLASNEGHSFGNQATSLAVNRATELFLGRCLGGRVQRGAAPEIERTLKVLTVDLDSLVQAEVP